MYVLADVNGNLNVKTIEISMHDNKNRTLTNTLTVMHCISTQECYFTKIISKYFLPCLSSGLGSDGSES